MQHLPDFGMLNKKCIVNALVHDMGNAQEYPVSEEGGILAELLSLGNNIRGCSRGIPGKFHLNRTGCSDLRHFHIVAVKQKMGKCKNPPRYRERRRTYPFRLPYPQLGSL